MAREDVQDVANDPDVTLETNDDAAVRRPLQTLKQEARMSGSTFLVRGHN